MNWDSIALRWSLGITKPEEIPGIALKALEEGVDSWRLASLAGDSPRLATSSTTGVEFERALRGLGVEVPDLASARDRVRALDVDSDEAREFLPASLRAPTGNAHGIEWWAPWDPVEPASQLGTLSAARLGREVGAGHVLFGIAAETIGAESGSGERLFRLLDGSGRVARVHLCFGTRCPETPPYPSTNVFDSLDQWASGAMREDYRQAARGWLRYLTDGPR